MSYKHYDAILKRIEENYKKSVNEPLKYDPKNLKIKSKNERRK